MESDPPLSPSRSLPASYPPMNPGHTQWSPSNPSNEEPQGQELSEDVWIEQQRISRPLMALHILYDHYHSQPALSIPIIQVPNRERWLHSLVQSVTQISANAPGRMDGAAAAVEIHGASGASTAVCKVRLAFSENDSEERLRFMNELLGAVEKFVFGTFFGEEVYTAEKRFVAVSEFTNNTLNTMIAKHNMTKLTKYLTSRVQKFLYVWESVKRWIHLCDDTNETSVKVIAGLQDYASILDQFVILFNKILDPSTASALKIKYLALCIEKAWKVLHQTAVSFCLEYAWEILKHEPVMYNFDEHEVWDGYDEQVGSHLDSSFYSGLTEPPRSLMLKVILTFARYAISCHIVAQSVYELHALPHEFTIELDLVPNYGTHIPISTQRLDLPENLQEVFDELNIPADIRSVPAVQERWEDMLASTRLRVHPEVQLALFYAHNPEYWPESGIIATSKHPCTACQIFLGLMSRHHNEGGRSLMFSYDATQHRPDGTWMLPPMVNNESSLAPHIQSLQRKLLQVAKEMVPRLESELAKTVQGLYYDPDYPPQNGHQEGMHTAG